MALKPVASHMARTDQSELPLSKLETKLGYVFSDKSLLVRALTHRSALPQRDADALNTYQRLEFMGDRVLAVVIAEMLYRQFPLAEEGELARRLTGLVRNETCAAVAEECGMADHIILGDGERRGGGRKKAAILGDVCEAVLAAIYFDSDMDGARSFIDQHWRERMENWSKPLRDPKSALQEWAHGRQLPTPHYVELSRSGPDHALYFVMEAFVEGVETAKGSGNSKREAEQKAAVTMLVREGVWEHDDYE